MNPCWLYRTCHSSGSDNPAEFVLATVGSYLPGITSEINLLGRLDDEYSLVICHAHISLESDWWLRWRS